MIDLQIDALYNAFKIKKTIPEIEKYEGNLPNDQKIDSILKIQKKLIEELKSLKTK